MGSVPVRKKVCRNWDMIWIFVVLMVLNTITTGELGVSLTMIVLLLPLVTLACHWVYAPQGAFARTEYANGAARITYILRKTEQTIDLAGAAYLYRIRKIMPFLVMSDAPLASRQEALAAYKSGQAGLVIMLLGDELYPYEKKAIELK